MKEKRFKRLFVNTILFAIGQFGTTILGVVLVPLYTNCMTTVEYGNADLVLNLASMLLPIVTLSIMDGIIKFTLDGEHDEKTVFSVSFFICMLGLVFSCIGYPFIYKYGYIAEYIFFFYLILGTNILNNLFLAYTKALQNIRLYTVLALLRTFTMLISNIVMLTILNVGVKGYLLSYIIANVASCAGAFIYNKLWTKISVMNISKETTKEMVLFSLPLIPNNFSGWAMTSMDKYMLTYLMGAGYNGLYTVAHKIPSVVNMFSSVFNQAWNYSALEEQQSSDYKIYYRTVFRIYSSYMFILASAVLCIVRPVMLLWVGSEFKQAWRYSPYLLISIIFSCFGGFYVPLFVTVKKTNHLFISTMIGTIVNGVLNWKMIPLWGINGASFSTVVTHFTVWLIRGIIIEKYTSIGLNKYKAYVNAILLMTQSTLLIFSGHRWFILQTISLCVILIFNRAEVKVLIEKIVRIVHKIKEISK